MKTALFAGLAMTVTLAAVFLAMARQPKSDEWVPYSPRAIAENKSEGKPSAVLFYARWALSADPNGGLATPAISQSLLDAGFTKMSADMTDSDDDIYREFKRLGYTELPVLVLYPTSGPHIGFTAETSESEIISVVRDF